MHQYKKLKIWQKAMNLSLLAYNMTKAFPSEEKYGLSQQIRRAAVSIPSNIAEGAGRITEKEFKYFLRVSYGSSCELETQLIIASEMGYITKKDFNIIANKIYEIQKMTYSFYNSQSMQH